MLLTRLNAARHELACIECRVTWSSWAQRLIGLRRGHTPRISPARIERNKAIIAKRAERKYGGIVR